MARTFKAEVQGLLNAAKRVAGHKEVPDAVAKGVARLQSLLSKDYSDMDGEAVESLVFGLDAVELVDLIEAADDRLAELIEATKTEDGEAFPSGDYAYVPDPDTPSTWKLRLTSTPGGTPDARIVGAAIAALGRGFRGQKVEIPSEDLPAVKRKVRAAWRRANPDMDIEDMPAVIRESGTHLTGDGAAGLSEGGESVELVEEGRGGGFVKR